MLILRTSRQAKYKGTIEHQMIHCLPSQLRRILRKKTTTEYRYSKDFHNESHIFLMYQKIYRREFLQCKVKFQNRLFNCVALLHYRLIGDTDEEFDFGWVINTLFQLRTDQNMGQLIMVRWKIDTSGVDLMSFRLLTKKLITSPLLGRF